MQLSSSVLAVLSLCQQGDTEADTESPRFIILIFRDEHLSLVNLEFLSVSEEKQTLKRMSHLTSFLIKLITP